MERKTYTKMCEEKFELANKWIRLQNKKISVLQGLKNKGIERIILYGASEFALRLLEQCENEKDVIEVVGIADRKVQIEGTYYKDIPLLSMDDVIKMDRKDDTCIVITAMGFYEEIADMLRENGVINFTSLKELIYDVYC